MNQLIGNIHDIDKVTLIAMLKEASSDEQRLKAFIWVAKQYNNSNIINELLDVAIYAYPHLEETLKKHLILL